MAFCIPKFLAHRGCSMQILGGYRLLRLYICDLWDAPYLRKRINAWRLHVKNDLNIEYSYHSRVTVT